MCYLFAPLGLVKCYGNTLAQRLRRDYKSLLHTSPVLSRIVVALFTLLIALVTPLHAHPLGNTTINRQAELFIQNHQLTLIYRMDFAEIPTVAILDEVDSNGDEITQSTEWQGYLKQWSQSVRDALTLTLNGQPLRLQSGALRQQQRAGEAGLSTLLLEARFTAVLPNTTLQLTYTDHFQSQQTGWKEIWVHADSQWQLQGNLTQGNRSQSLSVFPATTSPPNETHIAFSATPLSPAHHTARVALATPTVAEATRTASTTPAINTPDTPTSAASIPPDSPHSTGAAPQHATSTAKFFLLGMHHIATGWDHLLFLLGLLLLNPRIRSVIKVVSAFTLAHSVTLMLAAIGWVSPPSSLIEPAIALTIAYVGGLGCWRRNSGHSATLALLFGLVHGFGFAGALQETLGTTMQSANWLINLLSFNLGIEFLQLLLVGCALWLYRMIQPYPWLAKLHHATALIIFLSGLILFFLRSFL